MANDFMPSLLEYIRRNRILGAPPLEPIQPMPPMQQAPAQAPSAPSAAPSMPYGGAPVVASQQAASAPKMGDMYRQHVSSMPQRANPGYPRKLISGAIAGMANLNTPQNTFRDYEHMIDPEYDRNMQDWETRGKHLYQAANEENRDETNQRIKTTSDENLLLKQDNLALKNRSEDNKTAIARERLALDNWRARNQKGLVLKDMKSGKIVLVDPISGKETQTTLEHGLMSDLEKINAGLQDDLTLEEYRAQKKKELADQDNAANLNEIAARGNQARRTVAASGEQTRQNINTREAGIRGRAAAVATQKPKNELERMRRVYNNANQFIADNPDLADYIVVGDSPNQPVRLEPPGSGTFLGIGDGLSQEDYDTIYDAVYEGGVLETPVAAPQTTPTAKAPATPTKPAAPATKVIVQRSPSTGRTRHSKDGGKTWIEGAPK